MPSIRPLAILVPFLDARRALALAGCASPGGAADHSLQRVQGPPGAGEVSECTIEQDEIAGKVTPKPGPAAAPGAKAGGSPTAPFLFRSVRIEDPKLVEDLQKAGIEYQRRAPGDPLAVPLGLALADRCHRAALVGAFAPTRGRG